MHNHIAVASSFLYSCLHLSTITHTHAYTQFTSRAAWILCVFPLQFHMTEDPAELWFCNGYYNGWKPRKAMVCLRLVIVYLAYNNLLFITAKCERDKRRTSRWPRSRPLHQWTTTENSDCGKPTKEHNCEKGLFYFKIDFLLFGSKWEWEAMPTTATEEATITTRRMATANW